MTSVSSKFKRRISTTTVQTPCRCRVFSVPNSGSESFRSTFDRNLWDRRYMELGAGEQIWNCTRRFIFLPNSGATSIPAWYRGRDWGWGKILIAVYIVISVPRSQSQKINGLPIRSWGQIWITVWIFISVLRLVMTSLFCDTNSTDLFTYHPGGT